MLRFHSSTRILVRSLHGSSYCKKPLDFASVGRNLDLNKSKPFSINNTVYNDKTSGKQAILNSEKAANRFATMFGNEATKHSEKSKPRPKNASSGSSHGSHHSNRFGKPDSKRPEGDRKPHRRIVRFEFKTGTLQAQTSLKSLISKVHEQNTHYKVKYIEPETNGVVTKFLVDITNNLDLKQYGLTLIVKEGDLPMVKRIKVEEMIRSYTEQLALEKENELLKKGSIVAQKVVKQRMKAEKKKSAAKTLTIFWKISIGDLRNQKKGEILRKLNKGEKFTLYLKSKSHFSEEAVEDEAAPEEPQMSKNNENILYSTKYKDEHELNVEMKRRDMIFQELISTLDELPCTYKVEGKVETRYLITVSPKDVEVAKASEIDPEVDLKKQKKLQRQQEREQKAKNGSKQKIEDLDSLYSFKIED